MGPVSHRVNGSQARDFLATRYGLVDEVEPLRGGFWSSAYGFSCAGRRLVVRFGANKEWFEVDRAAMAFDSPGLPVPEVLEIGDAFGGAYAVSARHYGTNLEDLRPEQLDVAGPMLASLFGALFRVPKSPDLRVAWHEQAPQRGLTWRDWILEHLSDDHSTAVDGWRRAVAAQPEVDRVFRACEGRVRGLVQACPERRDLVHGDLLHANVLVADDASRPSAVFSWKCSVRGDFLYDAAWCSFWAPWHPGIAAADPLRHIQQEPSIKDDAEAWVDASLRHHCYELHIGATHLGWNAWIGDLPALHNLAGHLSGVLERGAIPIGT